MANHELRIFGIAMVGCFIFISSLQTVRVVALRCDEQQKRCFSLKQFDNDDDNDNDNDTRLPLKVCRIAAEVAARVNLLYSSAACASSSLIDLEQRLYGCMAQLTIRTMNIELYAQEPARNGSSLSIFIIPETAEQAALCVLQLTDWLFARQRLKHNHKYIFIWPNATQSQLSDLFQALWSKHILKAIALIDSKRVYTYEPFTLDGFALKLCSNENYFYDKLENLHGFELKISMFVDPQRAQQKDRNPSQGYAAIDGRVAETVIEVLNATAKYIPPADNENYGACRDNDTLTGALKYIATGATHVGFNSRFNLECMQRHIEELYPYRRRYLYLIVPAADMRPGYRIFIDAFNNSLWTLLVLNFLLVLIFFALLQRCVHNLPIFAHMKLWRWYEIFELLYKTQLGEPVDAFVRISSLREFLIAWIVFSYVLSTIYFGKLESSFVSPAFERELNSLNELSQLDMPIYAVGNIFDAVENTLEPIYWKHIKSRAIRLPHNYSAFPYAYNIVKKSRTKKLAFILRDETAKEFLARTYNSKIGRPDFHAVKEYLRSIPRTYIVTPGSPFFEKFQYLISSFYEFGLLDYWLDQDLGKRLLHIANADNFQDDFNADDIGSELSDENIEMSHIKRKRVVLNLEILQGAFYVWLFGISLSTISFISEHIVYWMWKNRKSKNP